MAPSSCSPASVSCTGPFCVDGIDFTINRYARSQRIRDTRAMNISAKCCLFRILDQVNCSSLVFAEDSTLEMIAMQFPLRAPRYVRAGTKTGHNARTTPLLQNIMRMRNRTKPRDSTFQERNFAMHGPWE